MNQNDPQFWMMISSIVIAVCFIAMAIALIAIAVIVRRAVKTVSALKDKFDPLLVKVNAMSVQGKEISFILTRSRRIFRRRRDTWLNRRADQTRGRRAEDAGW
jgi:ABC-type siderophore export system fused ATPase/permease subunit